MTNNSLRPAPVSTDKFTWDRVSKKFIAEISDLGKGFTLGRVWNDSCDEGLTLISHRTGAELVFVVENEVTRDGDFLYWSLKSTDGRFEMTLFND